jgi:hypothetical protein
MGLPTNLRLQDGGHFVPCADNLSVDRVVCLARLRLALAAQLWYNHRHEHRTGYGDRLACTLL